MPQSEQAAKPEQKELIASVNTANSYRSKNTAMPEEPVVEVCESVKMRKKTLHDKSESFKRDYGASVAEQPAAPISLEDSGRQQATKDLAYLSSPIDQVKIFDSDQQDAQETAPQEEETVAVSDSYRHPEDQTTQ